MHKLILFLGICSSVALGIKLPEPAKIPAKKCEKIIGCYYTISLSGVAEPSNLFVKDIDVHLCTHVLYKFITINADASITCYDSMLDFDTAELKQFNDIRKKNPKLKTLASMGGFIDQSTQTANNTALTNPALREKLVNNVIRFVKKYGFSGIDIDYSVPPQRGGRPSDKKNFVLLLKALRERFDKEHLILSVAVDPNEATAKILYDIKGISTYVDFINLKTFDFHGNSRAEKEYDTENEVGHTTPMYPSSKENAEERKRNIDYVVKYWISEFAPPRKLILGTSFNGASYNLANPKHVGRGAPVISGEYGNSYAPNQYNNVCGLKKVWKYIYDKEQQVPYIYNGNLIIAYDDVHSMKTKAEYAEKMNLGGAVADVINDDDHNGVCGEKFALLKTLNRVLRNKC